MFRTAYQRGFLTVFYSVGSKPLDLWEVHIQNGHIARLLDPDIKSMVLDIRGTNVSTSYILCPSNNRILGITMPFMILVVKNLKKYFTFEVTIMDDTGARRRFRVSNFQSTTQIMPLSTVMPIGLADGWNQIQFNLSEFTRRAYNKAFVEVHKIKVNANIRLRRIYFAEKLTAEEDLPPEYRIFLPLPSKVGKSKKAEPEGGQKETTLIKAPSKQVVSSPSKLKTASMASIVDIPQSAPLDGAGPSTREEEPQPAETVVTEGQETPVVDQPAPAAGESTPAADDATTAADETVSVAATTTTEGEVAELPAIVEEGAQLPTDETQQPSDEAAPTPTD